MLRLRSAGWIGVVVGLAGWAHAVRAQGFDCNSNGRDDAEEIAEGRFTDCNQNGFADECEAVARLSGGAPDSLPLGDAPTRLLAGDFDADGRPEIAAALGRTGDIAIVEPDARRNVDVVDRIDVCTNEGAFAAGDFDGDGADDVALGCSGSRTVRIVSPVRGGEISRVDVLAEPVALASADWNGDGRLDLVAATTEQIVFVRGTGDGRLLFDHPLALDGVRTAGALLAPDIDGDSFVDLAVVRQRLDVATLVFRDADGPDASRLDIDLGVGAAPAEIVAGHFDLGDRIDFAIANQGSGQIAVLRHADRPGEFTRSDVLFLHEAIEPAALAAGDLNEDGLIDLVVGGVAQGPHAAGRWLLRSLVGIGGAEFSDAEDMFGESVNGRLQHASIVAVDLVETTPGDELAEIYSYTPGRADLDRYVVENEGGGFTGCRPFVRGDANGERKPRSNGRRHDPHRAVFGTPGRHVLSGRRCRRRQRRQRVRRNPPPRLLVSRSGPTAGALPQLRTRRDAGRSRLFPLSAVRRMSRSSPLPEPTTTRNTARKPRPLRGVSLAESQSRTGRASRTVYVPYLRRRADRSSFTRSSLPRFVPWLLSPFVKITNPLFEFMLASK